MWAVEPANYEAGEGYRQSSRRKGNDSWRGRHEQSHCSDGTLEDKDESQRYRYLIEYAQTVVFQTYLTRKYKYAHSINLAKYDTPQEAGCAKTESSHICAYCQQHSDGA